MKREHPKTVLALNSGSATIKFALYRGSRQIVRGQIERISLSDSSFQYTELGKKPVTIRYADGIRDHHEAIQLVLGQIGLLGEKIRVIGHRVVHGGRDYTKATLVSSPVYKKLQKISALAPLHNPANLAGIQACRNMLPAVPNVAVFDTGWFAGLDPAVAYYSIPLEIQEKYHIRRYGFHGISHQSAAKEAARRIGRPLKKLNMVSCHLGSGCSVTAIRQGKAFDTSMGFTPLEGLTMSTRSGDIDPAAVLYLLRQPGWNVEKVETLLTRESGWKGVSGISADFRDVLSAAGWTVPGYATRKKYSGERKRRAKLAVDMFIYDVQRYIGAYISRLGHVDAVIFTGAIGERNATVRRMILAPYRLPSRTKVLVIPADEEKAIAQAALHSVRS
ncbi:MAG: acetate/propionate family kinase [bacterium]|nr:acetate/propionate family kinase [bacterium]